MGQRARHDYPGCWHHVVNRGIARRSVFEGSTDVRYFCSRLARVHRQGLLETHAFCFMLTHFHLLVRSPVGELSRAIRNVTNPFARWFNRRRRRDGPLFRGRFLSRPVESDSYWWTLVRYIDHNPVKAGLVVGPEEYAFGSAARYARAGPRPRWLTRSRIEDAVASCMPGTRFNPEDYHRVFAPAPSEREVEIIERRLQYPYHEPDALDELLCAGPDTVRSWQRMKCELADGTRPGLPVVTPGTVFDLLETEGETGSDAHLPRIPPRDRGLLASGLLHEACGLSFLEIATRLGCSTSSAHRWARRHAELVVDGGAYAEIAARALAVALQIDHTQAPSRPGGSRRLGIPARADESGTRVARRK